MQACACAYECAALIILAAEAHRPLGRIITGLYLTVRFAMQVARSLRIRSHRLAVPAGKARRTQVQLHAATRGNVGWLTDTSLLPERKMHANLLFVRCTQPEADGSREYAYRPTPAENRIRRGVEHFADHFAGNAHNGQAPL